MEPIKAVPIGPMMRVRRLKELKELNHISLSIYLLILETLNRWRNIQYVFKLQLHQIKDYPYERERNNMMDEWICE